MKAKIGRYAVCGAGRIGKIEGIDRRGYYGTGVDGKVWVSRTPRFVKRSQERYIVTYIVTPNAAVYSTDLSADVVGLLTTRERIVVAPPADH